MCNGKCRGRCDNPCSSRNQAEASGFNLVAAEDAVLSRPERSNVAMLYEAMKWNPRTVEMHLYFWSEKDASAAEKAVYDKLQELKKDVSEDSWNKAIELVEDARNMMHVIVMG